MNRVEKRRQRKLAKQANKNEKPDKAPGPAPQQQLATVQEKLNQAVQHHAAGQLSQAESVYQQVLQIDSNQPVALHLLGVVAHQTGKADRAVDLISRAIAMNPSYTEAYCNLGNILQEQGNLDEAVAKYQKAIAFQPDYAEAHYNLGNTLDKMEKIDEAVTSYLRAVEINSGYAKAHNNLANMFKKLGKLEEAVHSYNMAITAQPGFAEAHNNLGNALQEQGLFDEAVASYLKALALIPEYAEAHNNLGNVQQKLENFVEAEASYNKAVANNPNYADAYSNLGNVMKHRGALSESVECYDKAISLEPDNADAHYNLGNVFKEMGNIEEAVSNYRKAFTIRRDFTDAHSNLLFAEQYRLGNNSESLYRLHCQWESRHGRNFQSHWPEHQNTPDPNRDLRVGIVSPDLGRHPVGSFVIGMLKHLQQHQIKSTCYSDRLADDVTQRIKEASSSWREVSGVSDENLAQLILDDAIDILIDLSGHSANNRLLVFARKPAPIQVTWAGYVGTTGLSAIDYLISDKYSTKPEEEEFYSEKILRMPNGWLCYTPPSRAPSVGPLPYKQNGYITFCSFSNMVKINAELVSVWAQILDQVSDAKLLIKYKNIDARENVQRLEAMFKENGIAPSRLILEGQSPHSKLLGRYNDVDIALDPFPYSGGVTTYEALWMGVPVITVPGETFASRHSQSHLSTMKLGELVAPDREGYVKLAVELARDVDRLEMLRTSLRTKMAYSPSCNGELFAKDFSEILRNVWRDWCLSQKAAT